ncbi:ATP-dependent RNA helicase HrpA [Aggregicoccus sp. 17bor-14]|uniref:ATP-dependent RNA helicase HrpA n=1 Tax=Myxococcaceae TaxID=31 RepID=UPI00129C6869|nr:MULTISPECIES: ATP-dependent RNA helicase HrpA [Myxococcaceae]MBF5043294.1 ATP-dependent RNA helicase HrpA [Simulacricoccus sp. 17bor-14]MRI89052.1 ATP-dependent RNA helicase HrpA [Aggregicoccus sp. 17bor-14]
MSGDSPIPPGSGPLLRFPPELPISARVEDITQAIRAHQVVIVAGATGSGKTTQLPKVLLAMGRGRPRQIGVTQPRRIAATSVAARVARELGTELGTDVGYQIRFEDRSTRSTAVKFMTDGVLLAQIHSDPLLRRYDTIVLDEAHERSLTIDFLLGWLKRLLPQRPDLKVVVSSATIETERFSRFFGGAPVIQVEGRTFPVDVLYEPPPDEAELPDAVADAVANVLSLDPDGDVLVFLPGEREIRETESALNARSLRGTVVQPLYARLSAAEQSRVFASIPERRVILATNVAETSVTLPGIVYVVDTGVARLSRYDPRSGTTRLHIEPISQASADQRKGRCGRVREGICVRLYDEAGFTSRPAFTDPEIKRTGLAGVILRMKSLDLGDVEDFPFLDPPQSKAIAEGWRVLEELGAIEGKERTLTPLGHQLARFPVDPRIARMILAGAEYGCLDEVLIVAAALNLQDPRERPRELAQKADELHRRFRDESSDFTGLLKLWAFVREAEARGTSHLRRVCRDNFLSFLRVREWRDVQRQLEETVRELRLPRKGKGAPAPGDALHQALLTGLLSRIGQWNPEQRHYTGAKQTRFMLHPSSALARKPPGWVMAFELVETSQLFARTAAKLDPAWLAAAAPHLLKRSYSDPHWSEKSARAVVKESATLYGLQVFKDRPVPLAHTNAAQARWMFLEHALVSGEYRTKGAFQERNRQVLERVAVLRDKARRSELLDEDAVADFFDQRVPLDVTDGAGFEAWRRKAEAADPDVLVLTMEDALAHDPGLSPARYPDVLTLHGASVPVTYTFDPSAEDDGITLSVPLLLLAQLAPGELDWTIPGWQREKLTALLEQLPRAQRKALGPLPELIERLEKELVPFRGPMLPALAGAVSRLCGVEVPESAFRADAVPPYLRTTLRVLDEGGKELARSRDADALIQQYGGRARTALRSAAPATDFERKGLTAWTFSELPAFVTRRVGGLELRSYPALVDRGAAVDLVLLETAAAADAATRTGVRRLLMLAARGHVAVSAARMPPPFPTLDGAPPARGHADAFKALVLARSVDEAFGLLPGAPLPRTKAAFEALVREGSPRIEPAARAWATAVAGTSAPLASTLAALKAAGRGPSGSAAVRDIRAQLGHLFPADLLEWIPLSRLLDYPRYLRAAQLRLSRAVENPLKDAGKAQPFTPLWEAFLAKRATVRDLQAAEELRWAFEELRVALFAPEVTTPVSVTVAKVGAALAALR